MTHNRRDIGRIALAGAASALSALASDKPNSKFNGVQIGAITYSFRGLPGGADETLKYCLQCGISGIEMMGDVAESDAGAPRQQRGPGGPGGRGPGGPGGPGGARGGRGPGGPGGPGGPPPGGMPRRQLTPEQEAAMKKSAEEMKSWRLSVSMDKYKALRKMYEDAGVKTYAFKLPPTMAMSDEEYEYIWNVAEALGANHITMELPNDDAHLKRVADFAAKRKFLIAFHTHGQGGSEIFEKALAASKYTAINFDIGHYVGVNAKDPIPVMVKYHDRIASLHLKDRKKPSDNSNLEGPGGGGPNMPWGQGDTPLKALLQTMKKNKYKFPGSVEYEYPTPEGSDVLAEIKKCVEYCKAALA